MVLVFDLDDTLYREITYVESGFAAVSEFLEYQFGIPQNKAYRHLLSTLRRNGRGRVFDDFLSYYGVLSKENVASCLAVYRRHQPNLKLPKTSESCLLTFDKIPKYLVTDGNKLVQQKKIKALKIESYFQGIYITHMFGVRKAKPSPYCFLQISKKERISPSKIIYIGDNPKKDFVGIRPLGFRTVRVLKGAYKNLNLSKEYEADVRINSLEELNMTLVSSLVEG